MNLTRRDFMKLVGVSVASLALTRCRTPIGFTCYVPLPPSPIPTEPLTAREHLVRCWLSFGELEQATIEQTGRGSSDNPLGQLLISEHQAALDELVVAGELTISVANLIQEAYEAAAYHVWRSNTTMTCYEPMIVNYAPASAENLVQQSAVLDEITSQNTIDPAILEKIRTAVEHDMAFYSLTEAELDGLYDQLIQDWQTQQNSLPSYEDLDLEVTLDAETAARFIIDLLINK